MSDKIRPITMIELQELDSWATTVNESDKIRPITMIELQNLAVGIVKIQQQIDRYKKENSESLNTHQKCYLITAKRQLQAVISDFREEYLYRKGKLFDIGVSSGLPIRDEKESRDE